MTPPTPLYLLSGPTASGKTAVAHLLAERMGLRLLSVDSMMVYRNMDIGTAKPSQDEITRYDYCGLNLCNPGDDFSTGKWIQQIARDLDARPTLAVGGTGLYFRALIDGLTEKDSPGDRQQTQSVSELQAQITDLDPLALSQLADPENPRRLERALTWLQAGKPLPATWQKRSAFPAPVLRWPVADLNARILQRATDMFEQGLLAETQALLSAGSLTGTAAQAIGYAEAQAVLLGEINQPAAIEAIATRTRRYAKRQRTWFRNQMDARWVDVENTHKVELIADKIAAIWQDTGPFSFNRSAYG